MHQDPRSSPPEPLVESVQSITAPDSLAENTLKGGGMRDTLFVTANAGGRVVGMMLDSSPPGALALLRYRDAKWTAERRTGNLVLGTVPLIGTNDLAQQQVQLEEATSGLSYVAPLRIAAIDAGAGASQTSADGYGWWGEETIWRLAADHPDQGLLRAVTAPLGSWSVIDFYAPGSATPRWRIRRVASQGPSRIVDATLTPRGDRAFVQLSDDQGTGQLVAYQTGSGDQLWVVNTAPPVYQSGAVLASNDGAWVLTIVRDARCETCEKAELHDATTGALIREVSLDGADIFSRRGRLGYEKVLGISGDRLWFRYVARRGHDDSMAAAACTYDSWDLHTGSRSPAPAEVSESLSPCASPLRLAPVHGGAVLGVRATGSNQAEVTRFRRAP